MINKRTYIICALLIIFSLVWVAFDYSNTLKEYSKTFYYLDTYIDVRLYSTKRVDDIFDNIEKMYKYYDELTSTKQSYDGINNIYNVNNTAGEVEINEDLYNLISYGVNISNESNGLISINMNEVVTKWRDFIKAKDEFPNINYIINSINFSENNSVIGEANINLNIVSRGYVTELVVNYLKENNIKYYVINIGGDIIVGDYYEEGDYSIALETPYEDSFYDIVYCSNKSVITRGTYNNYYALNDVYYTDIINAKTLSPSTYFKSVTVIGKDIKETSFIATMLYMLDLANGKKLLERYNNYKIYWYTYDDEVILEEI